MINRQDAMTDGRTISVVMCTYNGAKFVAEQIESIIGQTYPIYELIIQDDHSTDGTWEVLQGYQRKYPFIKVYMNESGKGVNRNFFSAFYRATGDFIAISAQDDIWEPRKLEWQVEAIGDAWLCAGMTRPFSDTNGVKTFFDERVANRCLERTIYCSMIAGHTMLFKRALLDKIPDWAYWSDYFLYDHFLQIVVESYEKLVYLDRVLVNQRRHLQAVTYSEPMNYAKTPMNMLDYLCRTFAYYRHPKVREGMDAYFSKLYELLSAIPADTISRTNALCLAFYQSKHSVQARMRLAMLCVRLRNKIFYSTEKDLSFSVLRAIYFPVSCSDYFRYFMYR